MRIATSHDVAKAFGKYQDEALAEEPVTVTRYGRPSVVIVAHVEYQRLLVGQPPRRRNVYRAEDLPDDVVAALDRVIQDAERRAAADEAEGGPSAA